METMLTLLALLTATVLTIITLMYHLTVLRKRHVTLETAHALQQQVAESAAARIKELEAGYAERGDCLEELRRTLATEASEKAVADALLTEERKAVEALKQQVAEGLQRVEASGKEVLKLTEELAQSKTRMEETQQAAEEKLTLLHDAEQHLAGAFATLSSKALQENNEAFLTLAKTKIESLHTQAGAQLEKRQEEIGRLITPITESLDKIDKSVRQIEVERAQTFQSVSDQLQRVTQETGTLSRALRQPSVRGRWGEMQLRNVVQAAGMQEHCDYNEQMTLSVDGGNLRPDMIVHLPDGKTMVIDAKVPLVAYLEAMEADDPAVQTAKLEAHVQQTRTHIDQLSKKEYWSLLDSCPDFVICFLPSEALYSAAVMQDSSLIEYAASRRVLLVSPTILIAVLSGVAYGWRQQQLAQSAQEISQLGTLLYERVRVLAEHFDGLGKALEGAVKCYNKAVGSLESRVLVTARQFPTLGTDNKETIEVPRLVEQAPRLLTAPELVHPAPGYGDGTPALAN